MNANCSDNYKNLDVNYENEKSKNYFYSVTPIHTATMHCSLPLILSSNEAGWNNIYLEFHRQPAGEIPKIYCQKHSLCIKTDGDRGKSERWLDDKFQSRCMAHGDVLIVPENISYQGQWNNLIEFILLGIEPKLVQRIAYESVDPEKVEILPIFPQPDPLIYQIAIALKTALLTNKFASSLYAETMANALSVHLLQYYSTRKFTLQNYTDGLPKHKLRQIIDYIQENLEQNLSIAELAELLQMSPHYFGRLFKQSMGITPYKYIIQCRVEKSKMLLQERELTIAEISQRVGFAHQSHLNHHFKRLVGVTPGQFRDR
ncbi:AraC family transcriptional regulator [Hyella patelloides LEGE 07179]|uniref:AraC family transcriptional regulator n=1 Tax=Hyella patelloides LEGE 07179 TaxID=945734 RepID=A0A563VJG4_9CYAN|nr:AraC family transcriptional regulator [Hyella patelloides]VEP11606.1 AraC family transcriptional regulator [Hyella patelloides LEGE 07179]